MGGRLGGECSLRMCHSFGATFTEIKDLGVIINAETARGVDYRTRRQARTGASITLRGILIAEIT